MALAAFERREITPDDYGILRDELVDVPPRGAVPAYLLDLIPKRSATVTAECIICSDVLQFGAEILALRCPCEMHLACAARWLADQRSCPLCRTEVRAEELAPQAFGLDSAQVALACFSLLSFPLA